jgi:hypothetical protein
MFDVPNPEVLCQDWLAPVPFAREREVQEVVRRLDAPAPVVPAPWIVGVAGPAGSGSSTVARRAARETLERLRRGPGRTNPRLLQVRVAGLKGTHGVASALLQRFDEGFDGRGFPVAEILAGLLRRLRRDGSPFVIVLDDVRVGGPDLAPIVRALAGPDRFLPEGEHGLPPWWTIVAGTPEALTTLGRALGPALPWGSLVTLGPYGTEALRTIVRDRAERALGRPPPSAVLNDVLARVLAEGGGSARAVELLRRALLGGGPRHGPGFVPRHGEVALRIEPWVVDAIDRASQGRTARLGEVRRLEAELARRRGAEPLPTTTLWRRIVRLEQAGYLRREIRTGGAGGTRSLVRLLTPVDEWLTVPFALQTRPGASAYVEGPVPPLGAPPRVPDWRAVPAG